MSVIHVLNPTFQGCNLLKKSTLNLVGKGAREILKKSLLNTLVFDLYLK